jgi:pSer/pThr/pTyr-binding forkhead associated (FHA) protein
MMPPIEPPPPVGRPPLTGRARIDLQGASCFLDREVASLGRGLDNDVVVEDPRVSRHHARLLRGPRGWELTDLASTNGTFINGKQIKQRQVTNGDTISLGGLEMKFYQDATKR